MLKTLNQRRNLVQNNKKICGKHKSLAVSADTKKAQKSKLKEQAEYKAIYDSPKIEYPKVQKKETKLSPMKMGPPVATNQQKHNLDNNCQSCLIFPEKDGSFIIPQKNLMPQIDPEDELDLLIKNYNQSEKEYLKKIMEKFTSYDKAPLLPEIKHLDNNYHNSGDKSITYSPITKMRTVNERSVKKPVSGGPVGRITHTYEGGTYKGHNIVGSCYQYNCEADVSPTRADSANLGPSKKNKFPRDIFSIQNKYKKIPA